MTDAGTRSGTAAWRWWRGPAWTGSPGWWSTWTCARWLDTDYLHIYYLHIYYLRIYYLHLLYTYLSTIYISYLHRRRQATGTAAPAQTMWTSGLRAAWSGEGDTASQRSDTKKCCDQGADVRPVGRAAGPAAEHGRQGQEHRGLLLRGQVRGVQGAAIISTISTISTLSTLA